MTTTDTTADGLLRAIAMHPAEDVPRLMYADHLQENGDVVRAEFIRVQCERARTEDPECLHCWPGNGCLFHALQRRELELLRLHEAEWRRPPCRPCAGYGFGAYGDGGHTSGLRCPTCRGTGSCGPLSECKEAPYTTGLSFSWKHTVTWGRGFPVVRCRLEDVGYEKRSWVDGTMMWLATPWAVAVVRTGGAFAVPDLEAHVMPNHTFVWLRGEMPFTVFEVTQGHGPLRTLGAARDHLNAAVHRLVVRAAYPQGEHP